MYLGRNPAVGTQKMLDSLESQFNGTLTTFNLRYGGVPTYPTLSESLIVSLGGVLQEPGEAYYVSSDRIVFSEAPPAGAECWILLYSQYGASTSSTPGLAIQATGEPMGFENRTHSAISFNSGTRTFSIAPNTSGGYSSYVVWTKGVKRTYSVSQSVQVGTTTGLYYIYFDAFGVLQYKTTYFTWDTETPVAYVYLNASSLPSAVAPFVADERHGIVLDWQTHEYLHRTRGAVIAEGFSISAYTTTGNGSADAHAQFDLGNGTFFDEDLEVNITHSASPTVGTFTQVLTGAAEIPVFYMSGSSGAWVRDAATEYACKQSATTLQYNSLSGSTWSTTPADNNRYVVSWIVATNDITAPVICILGQEQYTAIGTAEAVKFGSLTLTNFPIVEFRPLWKVIFQTSTGFTNTPNALIANVLDLRQLSETGEAGTVVSDHGLLSGLTDDDHAQYLHTTLTRTGVTAEFNTTGKITTTSNIGIGIINPSFELQVGSGNFGNVSGQSGVAITAASQIFNTFGTGGDLVIRAQRPSDAGGGSITLGGSTRGDFRPDSVLISTANTPRVFVNSTGNVGIGTTNPLRKLEVVGTLAIVDTYTTLFGDGGRNLELGIGNGSVTAAYIDFHTADDQVGYTDFSARIIKGAGIGGNFDFSNRGTGSIVFTNGATTQLAITSDGNVGIGTASPVHKLDVVGTINSSASISLGGELDFSVPGNKFIDFYTKDSSNNLYAAHLRLVNHDSTSFATAARLFREGAVELYWNNTKRIETTSGGIDVIPPASTAAWVMRAKAPGISNDSGVYQDVANNMQFAARDGAGGLRIVLDSNTLSGSYINTTAGFSVGKNSTVTGYTDLGTNLRIGSASQSATYSNTAGSATITVTSANHGLTTGDSIYIDFTAGTATDAYFNQVSVTNSSTFTVTASAPIAAANTNASCTIFTENQVRFAGAFGDGQGTYNHTVVSERLWGGADKAELLIFKGNDSGTTIQDNIRLAAAGDIYFHTGFAGAGMAYESYINSHGSTINSSTVSILSSGNVGLGTTNPISRLEVRGLSTFVNPGNQFLIHTGTNAATVIHRNDGSDYYVLLSDAGTAPSGTWNTLRPLTINLSNGGLTSLSGQVFQGGTRVGTAASRSAQLTVGFTENTAFAANTDIGDTVRALSIVNESTTTNAMSVLGFRVNPVSGSANAALDMKFVQTGATNTSALHYSFNHGGTFADRLTILSSGRVGIGSTNPTVAFLVRNGNTTYSNPEANDLPTIFASNTNNASATAHSILGARTGGANGGDPFVSFDIAGVVGWSIGVDNSDADKFKISRSWSDVGINNVITVNVSDNVGIGTTDPTEKLHVHSTASRALRTTSAPSASPANLDASEIISVSRTTAVDGLTFSSADSRMLTTTVTPRNEIGLRAGNLALVATGYISLNPNNYNTEAVRILSNGNVGIGIINPQTRLGVYSGSDDDGLTLEVGRTPSGGEGPALTFRHNTNNGTSQVFARIKSRMRSGNDASWSSDLSFYTGGNALTENFTIRGDGNVGIGTTAPSTKLHVWGGDITLSARSKATTGTTLRLSTTDASNKMELLIDHSLNSYWRIQSVEQSVAYRPLVLQNDGGNVGIGHTNPSDKLHILGGRLIMDNPLASQSAIQFNQAGAEMAVLYRPGSVSNEMRMYVTGGGDVMTWNNSGNVGIGLTNPSYKLEVSGRSNFNDNMKITPTAESWAEGLQFYMPNTSTWGGLRWVRNRSNFHGSWYQGWTALDSSNDMVFGHNASGTQTDNILRLYGSASGSARIGRDLYITGLIGGAYGNRLVVGANDTSYTLQDSNLRPTIQANGAYPVVSLNHTITGNTSHGPTIQFTCNGTGNQFVIGTTGNGTRLDIGFSAAGDWNPHNGIAGYNGTTTMSFTTSGNVGIGTLNPIAKLDVRGSSFQRDGVATTRVGTGYYEAYPIVHFNSDNGNPYITLLTVNSWSGGNSRVYAVVETWSVHATSNAASHAKGSALASYAGFRLATQPETETVTQYGGIDGGELQWSGPSSAGSTGFSLIYRGPFYNYTRTYIKVTVVSHDGADITLASATS